MGTAEFPAEVHTDPGHCKKKEKKETVVSAELITLVEEKTYFNTTMPTPLRVSEP